MDFAEIAELLPGRTATTVSKHFQNHIDPSLNKGLPTPEEMSKLKEEVHKYVSGKTKKNISWVEIVKLFPGRSKDQLKNWWNNANTNNNKKKRPPPPPPYDDDEDAANETTQKRHC
jgi:Myb-like DNA-binding domain